MKTKTKIVCLVNSFFFNIFFPFFNLFLVITYFQYVLGYLKQVYHHCTKLNYHHFALQNNEDVQRHMFANAKMQSCHSIIPHLHHLFFLFCMLCFCMLCFVLMPSFFVGWFFGLIPTLYFYKKIKQSKKKTRMMETKQTL